MCLQLEASTGPLLSFTFTSKKERWGILGREKEGVNSQSESENEMMAVADDPLSRKARGKHLCRSLRRADNRVALVHAFARSRSGSKGWEGDIVVSTTYNKCSNCGKESKRGGKGKEDGAKREVKQK